MKILMVSSYLPYPLINGGNVRLYNIIKQLSLHHEITLICEIRKTQGSAEIKELEKYCKKVITVPRKKQWSLQNVVITGVTSYPFLVVGHTLKKMREYITEELKKPYDLIHVETFYVFQNIPVTPIPIVLVEHNIEYLVYQRYANNLPKSLYPFLPLLYYDVQKLKFWEKKAWKEVTKLVAVSEVEKQAMGRDDTVVVANGVDMKKFRQTPLRTGKDNKKILFIGDFTWMQNRDTVSWLITNVWPKIPQKMKEGENGLKLWIVGRTIPENIKQMTTDPSILFDEDVAKESTETIFSQATLLLSPIRVGGGTSFKILEAMASNLPVITTTLGNEGIKAEKDKEIIIANTPEEIIKKIKEVVENEDKQILLGKHARIFVEENYSWDSIVKKLEAVYRSV